MVNKNKVIKNKACAQRKHRHISNNKTLQSGGLKITTDFIGMGWYESELDSESPFLAVLNLLEVLKRKPLNEEEPLARIVLEKQTKKWTIVDMKNKLIIPTPFTEDQMERAQNSAKMIYLMNRSRES